MSDNVPSIEDARKQREAQQHLDTSLDLISGLSAIGKAWAIRTPRGQKDPGYIKWDPKAYTKEKSHDAIDKLRKGDSGNLGIHLFGDMVDVDVDTDNPHMSVALDYFLPPTPHIWGRASRPRTHRLYQLNTIREYFEPSLVPLLKVIGALDELKVELRGGQMGSARYTLMPGSLHPSGEHYEWDTISQANVTPTITAESDLIKALRKACLVAYLAPRMVEGTRHYLYMGLCGFLYRVCQYTAENERVDPHDVLDEEDAREIVEGLIEVSGDTEYQDRMQTFESTWKKAEAEVKVTGAPDLEARLDEPGLARTLYKIMIDNEDLVEYDEFAAQHVIWGARIISLPKLKIDGANPYYSFEAFHNANLHLRMSMPDGSQQPMSRMLVASRSAQRVDALNFRPSEDLIYEVEREDGSHNELNLFTGYAVAPYEGEVTDEDVQPFLHHISHIICSDNPEHTHWVLAWLSDIFQNPDSKPGTALGIVGKPGAGKSLIGEMFIRPIIGYRHSAVFSDISAILGNFNQDSASKLFIQCDEALSTNQKVDAHRMKALVTDARKRVEPKGIDAFEVNDSVQYLLTSNELRQAIAIVDGMDDRRYTIVETNDKYATMSDETTEEEKTAYFDKLGEWAKDKENLAKLHKYLLDFEYERKTIRRPLATDARAETMQASMVGVADFLMGIAHYDNPFQHEQKPEMWWSQVYNKKGEREETIESWPTLVSYQAIKTMYDRYSRGKRAAEKLDERQIVQWMKKEKLLPAKHKSLRIRIAKTTYDEETNSIIEQATRVYVHQWPTKKELHTYLRRKYGYEPDEMEEIEAERAAPKKPTNQSDDGEF